MTAIWAPLYHSPHLPRLPLHSLCCCPLPTSCAIRKYPYNPVFSFFGVGPSSPSFQCGNWTAHCKSCYSLQLSGSDLTAYCCMHCNDPWSVTLIPTCTSPVAPKTEAIQRCLQYIPTDKQVSLSATAPNNILSGPSPSETFPPTCSVCIKNASTTKLCCNCMWVDCLTCRLPSLTSLAYG